MRWPGLLITGVLWLLPPPLEGQALEERIVSGLSHDDVPITMTFTGSEILVFGAVERSRFLRQGDKLPDIAVSISGPSAPVNVLRKDRVGGVWANVESVHIASAPSFYAVASTGGLGEILKPISRIGARISLNDAVFIAGTPSSAVDPEAFRRAVIRIRQESGLYRVMPRGVQFDGGTLFSARFALPPNIKEGKYAARVLLIRDGLVIDDVRESIAVHRDSIQRLIYVLSRRLPLPYGVASVLAALLFGWLGAEIFRRIRA